MKRFITGFLAGLFAITLFAWTYTYDTDTPAGSDSPSIIDDRIREVKDAVQERLNVEHVFDLTGTQVSDANTGKHTDITCDSVTSAGAISGTTIAGSGDFAINTDKFTVAAATGNTAVAGTLDVAGAAEVTGVATLGDASLLKTSAAPTTDAMLANKKYVDDQIAAVGSLFGAWNNGPFTSGTSYLAATDGFVIAYGGPEGWLTGFTDAANPPTTEIVRTYPGIGQKESITFPVKKGHYWKVFATAPAVLTDCKWMPIGQ